ncbi:MAG: PLP-dependent aminotransferase family protein [Caldilineaceae bacterium]
MTQPLYDRLFSAHAPDPRPIWETNRAKYDFAIAYPDPASVPWPELRDVMADALAAEGTDLAYYHGMQGYAPLCQFIAAKLQRDRNMRVEGSDVFLTAGAGQGISLTLEMLINPGDVVLTDDFAYAGGLGQMFRYRADVRGVPTDGEGMAPDALEAAILQAQREGKPIKLIYVVPSFQNPQGWCISLERRRAIVDLAQRYDILILEDDSYADLRYDGVSLPPLFTLDESQRVIYISTFSKTIAPSMRMGYMTGPRPLLERAMLSKSGGPVPLFVSLAVHRFCLEHLSSHIEQINDIQRARRNAMDQALHENFGDEAAWVRPDGGLSMWIKFPAHVNVAPARATIFAQDNVGYSPGTSYAADRRSGQNYMRLSYGYNTPDEIGEGIAALAAGFRREGVI